LYPWELDKEQTDYDRFHRLNDLAAEICARTDATLMDVGGILEPKVHRRTIPNEKDQGDW
jgi:hypothetical protein